MTLEIFTIGHIPEIRSGMNLAECLRAGIAAEGFTLQKGDILAVTQKIVSKAEGRLIDLRDIEPSPASLAIARQGRKDPRFVEVILRESRRIVRFRGEVLICETHHGFICANAGVDRSNVEGEDTVALLPRDPDRSAKRLAEHLGCGVIITDTFGRPWREGLVDAAIGIARVPPFIDLRGQRDDYGHALNVTVLAAADALAAAAGLAMGKTQRTPAALIRGFLWSDADERSECEPDRAKRSSDERSECEPGRAKRSSNASATSMLRTPEKDLFL
ncbi:MAG: coenzyme F420-0:L-glutamate ligase [Acidobacteria bacterium]|nr:coenzyme F420-0:L-glutamate ligase [Acidobacteriota bacterium]